MANTMTTIHPRDALREPGAAPPDLPVCDHYAGVELRMRKSLELQAELGPVFDVTLDNEDGAPVGAEVEQAHLIAELLGSPANRFGRVGVRLLPVDHPRFGDVAGIVLKATRAPAYLMLPKPEGLADLQRAVAPSTPRAAEPCRCMPWSRPTARWPKWPRWPRTRASNRCPSA
jgi:citrate lyase subunit beta/citryl-CoA lyase